MKKGTIWMSVGLLFIAAALVLTGYNVWDEKRAGEKSEEVIDVISSAMNEDAETSEIGKQNMEEVPLYKKYPDMEMPTVKYEGEYYVGVLEVPALGLLFPVMSECTAAKLKIAPCRDTGSVYTNDMIIAGHNYKTHFGKLGKLVPGERIIFTDVDDNRFEYEIIEIVVLDGSASAEMLSGDWDMTLYTCTYGGSRRLTLRCALLP